MLSEWAGLWRGVGIEGVAAAGGVSLTIPDILSLMY